MTPTYLLWLNLLMGLSIPLVALLLHVRYHRPFARSIVVLLPLGVSFNSAFGSSDGHIDSLDEYLSQWVRTWTVASGACSLVLAVWLISRLIDKEK